MVGFTLLFVNTPPAKAGGFGLRLKAGSIGHSADFLPLPKPGEGWSEGWGEGSSRYLDAFHPSSQPSPLKGRRS